MRVVQYFVCAVWATGMCSTSFAADCVVDACPVESTCQVVKTGCPGAQSDSTCSARQCVWNRDSAAGMCLQVTSLYSAELARSDSGQTGVSAKVFQLSRRCADTVMPKKYWQCLLGHMKSHALAFSVADSQCRHGVVD